MTAIWNTASLDAWWADRQRADAREWVRLSGEVGEWLGEMARRNDLVAVVEPGSGAGHPAVYKPDSASVEIDPDVCAPGTNPADIRMDREADRLRHPAFAGAAAHEGGHAAFSHWHIDQSARRRRVVAAALLLEESRMEKALLGREPGARVLLRATFAQIVSRGAEPPGTVAAAAHWAALTMARVDAGVLDAEEMATTHAELLGVLSEAVYGDLRAIWREAHQLPNLTSQAAMEALGERWVAIVDAAAKARGETPETPATVVFICGAGGGAGGEELSAVTASAEAQAAEARKAAEAAEAREARAAEAYEARAAEEAAVVFDKPFTFNAHSGGYGNEGLSGHRAPTAGERGQANALARALANAQHRERARTVVPSATPPGRLRSSAAVRRSAQRAMGLPVTAEPWRRIERRHVEAPPITVGIACDISGSMHHAAGPVATAAWAIAHAIHRNDGDAATVAYGNRVHPVVKPGENPRDVREFDATGGTEDFIGAVRALDGALGLSGGVGVRMLVVVSDGHYTNRQKHDGAALVKRLLARGVKVLWIGLTDRDHPAEGATYVHLADPTKLGAVVGRAMVDLLKAA